MELEKILTFPCSPSVPFCQTVTGEKLDPDSWTVARLDWTVHNFSFFKYSTTRLKSAKVEVDDTQWYLSLKPAGSSLLHKDLNNTALYLRHRRTAGSNTNLQVQAAFRIMGLRKKDQDVTLHTKYVTERVKSVKRNWNQCGTKYFAFHSKLFPSVSPLKGWLAATDDSLILRVDFRFVDPSRTISLDQLTIAERPLAILGLQWTDLRHMLESGAKSDYVLVSSDGIEKMVHQKVLGARSEFFKELFANEPKDQSENFFVTSMSNEVLNVMLKFLYCGYKEGVKTHAKELLLAAHEFGMDDLKKACEDFLVSTVTRANAKEMEQLASKLELLELQKAVKRTLRPKLSDFFRL